MSKDIKRLKPIQKIEQSRVETEPIKEWSIHW